MTRRVPTSVQRQISRLVAWTLIVYGSLRLVAGIPVMVDFASWISHSLILGNSTRVTPLALQMAVAALGSVVVLVCGLMALVRPSSRLRCSWIAVLTILVEPVVAIGDYGLFLFRGGLSAAPWRVHSRVLQVLATPVAATVAFLLLRRLLRDQSPDAGEGPICLACGYSMRGLTEPRCPECGRVYSLDEFHSL